MSRKVAILIFVCCVVGILAFAVVDAQASSSQPENAKVLSEASSEITVHCKEIYPSVKTEPSPSGIVDENPPYLHFHKPYGNRRKELGTRRYFFRLSQNPKMTNGLIESGPRKWSFYSPHKQLSAGTWYWQYGIAGLSEPASMEWSAVQSFRIRGNERPADAPSAKAFLKDVANAGHPRFLALPNEVGKLLPENPELREMLLKECQRSLDNEVPATFLFDESVIPQKLRGRLSKKQALTYRLKRTRDLFRKTAGQTVQPLTKAYLLTGEATYKEAVMQAMKRLQAGYREMVENNMTSEFAENAYYKTIADFFDVFYDELDEAKRQELLSEISKEAHQLYIDHCDRLEHALMDEHGWQASVSTLFRLALISYGEVKEAEEWLEYVYELWLFRGPASSRNDGGSLSGNGYFGAHERTVFNLPFVMSRITGYDYFDIPWYENLAKYLAYTSPPGHPAGAYGDDGDSAESADKYRIKLAASTRHLEYIKKDNPWYAWRNYTLEQAGKKLTAADILTERHTINWFYLHVQKQSSGSKRRTPVPPDAKAALFRDVGAVAMHTDMANPEKNLMVNFRSSPFGRKGHSHAAQNAFNVTYGGEKLFFRTGYYTSANDAFALQNYKHSRAHNTILPDGVGMDYDTSGYGWIARYANGERISYCLGDASNAFNGDYWKYGEMLKEAGVAVTPENGFGNPPVTRFRRHLLLLRPNMVVIYDELQAKNPINWTFRLNSTNKLEDVGKNMIGVRGKKACSVAKLFSQDKIKTGITDQFIGKLFDWQGKYANTPNHYHASLQTAEKVKGIRFLTLIEVDPSGAGFSKLMKVNETRHNSGMIDLKAAGFTIRAQMNAQEPSFLSVLSDDGKCALVTGQAARTLTLGGRTCKAKLPGSTLLMEESDTKGLILIEETDQLPDALVYGNIY